ncbi:MAG: dihydropteroate synthase [Desulfarculus sp.]|nr:dihydropteroate synthase [Desulfarculus sp.]
MLIIGEKINSTLKATAKAVAERDETALVDLAQRQVAAGAGMLDVNCGTVEADQEPEVMRWMVKLVQGAVNTPLCIDSANPAALAAGLMAHQGKAMVNSISGESERYRKVLPLLREHGASVIALGMDDQGIPGDGEKAYAVGAKLVEDLVKDGLSLEEIYFDPLVRSVATSPSAALETLDLMRRLGASFPGLHFASGLSNVSYGVPERRHLNRAYVVLSMGAGLDAVIMDPFDQVMVQLILASEVLLEKDRWCLRYIEAFNQGRLSA